MQYKVENEMGQIDLLTLAKAKLERAHNQILELGVEIRAFCDAGEYDIVSEIQADGAEQVWKFQKRHSIPADYQVVAGEILHNIRTPLDHLACSIALTHSGTYAGTYFPFGKSAEIFNREITQKAKRLPPEALDVIRELHPYKGGDDLLWYLHDLNRAEKHTPVLQLQLAKGVSLTELQVEAGDLYIVGSRYGQHLLCDGYSAHLPIDPTRDDGMEFLTTSPGARVSTDARPTFDITFRGAPEINGWTAVSNLSDMASAATDIINRMERFCVLVS